MRPGTCAAAAAAEEQWGRGGGDSGGDGGDSGDGGGDGDDGVGGDSGGMAARDGDGCDGGRSKSSGRGRKGRESARGEMAQRCKRLVCTRDVPHKLIVERARGAPALLGPGVPSGTSSSSIPDCSVKTLGERRGRERSQGWNDQKNGHACSFSRYHPRSPLHGLGVRHRFHSSVNRDRDLIRTLARRQNFERERR